MTTTDDILNFRRVLPNITTSGQPTEDQLAALKSAGVTHIVNLGPHTNKGALDDEPKTVADLGLKYTYIPVDFDAPTDADFEQFQQVLRDHGNETLHIHCIYNARVSAFFYRHSTVSDDMDASDTFQQMDGIWRPGGVWAEFIGKPEDADKPNRYLGYDY